MPLTAGMSLVHGGPSFCKWGSVLFRKGRWVPARVHDGALVTTFTWGRADIDECRDPVAAMKVLWNVGTGKGNRKYAIVRMCQRHYGVFGRLDANQEYMRPCGSVGRVQFFNCLEPGKKCWFLDFDWADYYKKELQEIAMQAGLVGPTGGTSARRAQ